MVIPATGHQVSLLWVQVSTLRQIGRHFAEDIFKYIFLNENVWIPIKISLKFLPKCRINNVPALVQIMAWRRPGDKPLSEPMMVSVLTHICVTRPQWVSILWAQVAIFNRGVCFLCGMKYLASNVFCEEHLQPMLCLMGQICWKINYQRCGNE